LVINSVLISLFSNFTINSHEKSHHASTLCFFYQIF
jgi:hypothetical protein